MWVARYAHPMSLNAWGTSWSSVACRSTSARTTGRSSPPGRCGCGSKGWEPQPSSSHRVALGRMGMLRASTASLGTNSWTGSSSIPSGRCRSSPSRAPRVQPPTLPQRPGLSPSCSRDHPHLLCSKRYQCLMICGTPIGGRSAGQAVIRLTVTEADTSTEVLLSLEPDSRVNSPWIRVASYQPESKALEIRLISLEQYPGADDDKEGVTPTAVLEIMVDEG